MIRLRLMFTTLITALVCGCASVPAPDSTAMPGMMAPVAIGSGAGTVDCIRWAKIDPTGPTVLDAGVLASDGDYRIFPDVAANACGDMAIGYTKSSAGMFPSVFVSGRGHTVGATIAA